MRRLCRCLILAWRADKMVPVEEAYHLQKFGEKKELLTKCKIYRCGHGLQRRVSRDAGCERELPKEIS